MNQVLFLSIALCFFQLSYAQNTGSLTGIVVDKSTQQPLDGVSIKLDGSDKGAIADSLGKFRIANVPVKSYNLEISKVGYKTFTLYNIVITSGNESNLKKSLSVNMPEVFRSFLSPTVNRCVGSQSA